MPGWVRWGRAVLFALLACLAAGRALAAAESFRYETRIEGVKEDWLHDRLVKISDLAQQQKHPPETFGELRSRIRHDLDMFRKLLRSEGYYDCDLTYEVDETEAVTAVRILVDTGDRYTLDHYTIKLTGQAAYPASVRQLVDDNKLVPGQFVVAGAIADLTQRVLTGLPQLGYPFADLGPQNIVADHATKTVSVDTEIRTGPAVLFGPIRIEGNKSISQLYLRRLATFKQGQTYDSRLTEEYRLALVKTSLFSAVSVTPVIPPAGQREVTIDVKVQERVKRSYGGAVGYSSEAKFGVEAFWEHRNLFGQQELLHVTGALNELDQGVTAQFTKPNFRRRDQNLIATAAIQRQSTDAYTQYTVNGTAGVERKFARIWKVSANAGLDYSRTRDDVTTVKVLLVDFPLILTRDSSNDLLNPVTGSRATFSLTPFYGLAGQKLSFYRADLAASAYRPLDGGKRYVAAARVHVASLFGAPTFDIPADKRLYAGGGQSIRGYSYQHVSPLDPATGDPIGGRSLFEIGAEMRVKITDNYGVVPFVEGGNARSGSMPKPFADMRWGAGLGFRYYTSFAPVRIDVATPLNRRAGEGRVQVYISVGQAF